MDNKDGDEVQKDMDEHLDGREEAQAQAKAEAVKKQEDASQIATLFAYDIRGNYSTYADEYSDLEFLLQSRYGPSIFDGKRFQIDGTITEPCPRGWTEGRLKWIVHVPEEVEGKLVIVGRYRRYEFRRIGEEARTVSLEKMGATCASYHETRHG